MTFQKPAGSPSITPFLWFNDNAEEAVEFYLRVFPNLRRSRDLRNPGAAPGPKGGIVTIEFSLNGQPFVALNDGPGFPFTQAVSFFVSCRDVARHFLPWSLPLVARSAGFDSRQGPPAGAQDSSKLPPQEEIDYYWARLSDGGKEIQCGWLADRFGLSWQIVPEGIMDLVQHPAAFQAMMGMVKMDIAALRKAAGNKSGPLLPPPRVDV